MIKKIVTILVYCSIILLIGVTLTLGQEKEDSLQTQKITIQMDKQPLGEVFRYLMETYNVPIGFEQSILDRNHSDYNFLTNLPAVGKAEFEDINKNTELSVKVERVFTAKEHTITVNITNGKLSEVFDKIVSQMKNYKWEFNDGVVNIFPIHGRDERFQELLETKIEKFELAKGNTVEGITITIMTLREFRNWLSKNKLHFNPARTGPSILLNAQYKRKMDISINFSNLSFRELLNKITKIKKGGWILKWQGVFNNGIENIDLDI